MPPASSDPQRSTSQPLRSIWIDGTLVPWESATVHLLSHSLQRGSLVFDYLSVHDTPRGAAIFRLPEHLERFFHSVALVGLPLGYGREALHAAAVETVAANPGAHSLKICAYLPSIEVDVVPMDEHVAVAIAAYDSARDIVLRKEKPRSFPATVTLKIERTRRRIEAHLPPHAKAASNYLGPMMAKWAARKLGFDEVVLVDETGHLAEGPTTNVFLVDARGVLRTPPLDRVLAGVTRASLLELAKHEGIPTSEDPVRPEALLEAPEVFLAGTSAGVWPVVSVDGRTVGKGVPGPISLRLKARLDAATDGRDRDFEHWLTYVRP
jgi:branched-chain amino acid aminotransferase